MSNARAAHRYAKALLDLSIERNELDAVQSDLNLVKASMSESREFRNLLASPVIKPRQKAKILNEVFSGSLTETTNKFMALLVDHGREGMMAEVIKSFHTMYLKAKGITHAKVTTSTALTAPLREKFMSMVKEMTGLEVELEEKVNAELIGGFVLRVGDKQIDTSVAGQLHELKQQYKDNLYVADY